MVAVVIMIADILIARAQMIAASWNNSKNLKHPFPRVVDPKCFRRMLVKCPPAKLVHRNSLVCCLNFDRSE